MTESERLSTEARIAWGVAGRALPGEAVSGDMHFVKRTGSGLLVALVDGVGHGEEAAAAARVAVAVLEEDAESPLPDLVRRCHQALAGTRGAVMTVARLEPAAGRLIWLGVGNVTGLLLHPGTDRPSSMERVLSHRGLVGGQVPGLLARQTRFACGDLLLLATDGIHDDFAEGFLQAGQSPQELANQILERSFRGTDDALVLLARCCGPHL